MFRLSQDYPSTMPPAGPQPWKTIDFRTQPVDYLQAVLAYAYEGNVDVDFDVTKNTVRKWYHAPWMHAGATGREFIHGLTQERTSRPRDLHPQQTSSWQNWAVSVYNAPGGFVIGQVWADPDRPDPRKAQFPEGAVAIKLLFTQATVAQVPYLTNSLRWQADIHRSTGTGARPTLRLLQIDVAVRDDRANSTTGWVFGTFVYDGNASGNTPWERMVPLGLMWGNDPGQIPNGTSLVETRLNPAFPTSRIPQHLGFRGRLNGPVDDRRSSCLSCHSTAQIPQNLSQPNSSMLPPSQSTAVLQKYFRNVKSEDPFDPGLISLGYSLQLQAGIVRRARAGGLQLAAGVPPTGAAAPPSAGEPFLFSAPDGVRVREMTRGTR